MKPVSLAAAGRAPSIRSVNDPTPALGISAIVLQRVRHAYDKLELPSPALLRQLPGKGFLPFDDPYAWLRDGSGEVLAAAVRFQIGSSTLQDWYHEANGFALCPTALQTLRHHASIDSFGQWARGEPARLGHFRLMGLDEEQGLGSVHSSTPFCREWERGLIQGALDAAGDLLFSDVSWDPAHSSFQLRFVTEDNREQVRWALGEPEEAKVWRLRNRVRQLEQQTAYLEARPSGAGLSPRSGMASSSWLDPISGATQEAHLADRLRALALQPIPPRACVVAFGLDAAPSGEQLRQLGQAGHAVTRRDDLLARLGEHALALLLHEVDEVGARRVAQRLAERLNEQLASRLRVAVLGFEGGSEHRLLAVAKARLAAAAATP